MESTSTQQPHPVVTLLLAVTRLQNFTLRTNYHHCWFNAESLHFFCKLQSHDLIGVLALFSGHLHVCVCVCVRRIPLFPFHRSSCQSSPRRLSLSILHLCFASTLSTKLVRGLCGVPEVCPNRPNSPNRSSKIMRRLCQEVLNTRDFQGEVLTMEIASWGPRSP